MKKRKEKASAVGEEVQVFFRWVPAGLLAGGAAVNCTGTLSLRVESLHRSHHNQQSRDSNEDLAITLADQQHSDTALDLSIPSLKRPICYCTTETLWRSCVRASPALPALNRPFPPQVCRSLQQTLASWRTQSSHSFRSLPHPPLRRPWKTPISGPVAQSILPF